MHEFIGNRDDVLAVVVSGDITDEDLASMMDRVNDALARHETVHVYVEAHEFKGIQISHLPDYVKDAFPMVRKLRRFGRVAVVTDEPWVRIATRLESALLPGISYRVFDSRKRDDALAWVQEAPRT